MADGDTLHDYYYDYYGMNGSDENVTGWDLSMMEEGQHPLLHPSNIITSILATIGIVANIAGICSLMRHRNSQQDCTSSRVLLLLSLACSDTATCIIIPGKHYIVYIMKEYNVPSSSPSAFACTLVLLETMVSACQMISLLNLLGMAIDHWITFIKPFRHFEIVRRRRTVIMIVCLWLICLLLEFGIFLSGIKYMVDPTLRENSEPFCFIVADKPAYNPEYLLLIVAPICLTAIIIIYVSISKEINKLIVSAPPRQQAFSQARRALRTTYFILLTFLVCWLPMFVLRFVHMVGKMLLDRGYDVKFMYDLNVVTDTVEAHKWLLMLFVLNSILDPLIYMSLVRLKLTSLCETMKDTVCKSYVIINGQERQAEVGQSHTMVTLRSSVQLSANEKAMTCEPLLSNGV